MPDSLLYFNKIKEDYEVYECAGRSAVANKDRK